MENRDPRHKAEAACYIRIRQEETEMYTPEMELVGQFYALDRTAEEKAKELCEAVQEKLKSEFEGTLATFFRYRKEELPLVKAVEVSTQSGDVEYTYVGITQMPDRDRTAGDAGAMAMHIAKCLGVRCEKWGTGAPTPAAEKHLRQYLAAHSGMQLIPGNVAGYPKVLEISREEVDGAPNESYTVSELTGIMVEE